MDKKIAKEIKGVDKLVEEMYENGTLNTDQYSQLITQTLNVRKSVKDLTIETVSSRYIEFAVWIQANYYRKKEHTHPNKIGKWWSDYAEGGYLSDEELIAEFLKSL